MHGSRGAAPGKARMEGLSCFLPKSIGFLPNVVSRMTVGQGFRGAAYIYFRDLPNIVSNKPKLAFILLIIIN
jgi:hypothetical protein